MTIPASNSHTGVARYVQLATLFQRRIETDQWLEGKQIPTIDQLAAECKVARATVRQALDILESKKLIARYRAKGTFVIKKPPQDVWYEVATDWSGMLMDREGLTIEILSVKNGQHLPNHSGYNAKPAPAYKYLRRRHWRHGSAYYVGELYVDQRLSKVIKPAAFKTTSSMKLIKEIPGMKIKEAGQTMTIGSADLETAELLNLPLNAPVAYVNRYIKDNKGYVVLVTHGIYRGDVVRLDIKLR